MQPQDTHGMEASCPGHFPLFWWPAFASLPYYPVWAIIFIAVAVAIIWSLTAHGRDITEVYAEA